MQHVDDLGWIVPERGAPWLRWGFGTRNAVLRNEPCSVKQVHGAEVVEVTQGGFAGQGDALITNTPGILLGIKTADCLPMLLVDLRHRAVAAVHAGWRGTAQRIAVAAIRSLEEKYGTKPNELLVALGPAIGPCCFEVGPEVARELAAFDPMVGSAGEKCRVDLQAINAKQLERAGVLPQNILRNELCTVCNPDQFWSFRREREGAGRMWSVVGIEG